MQFVDNQNLNKVRNEFLKNKGRYLQSLQKTLLIMRIRTDSQDYNRANTFAISPH